MHTVAGLRRATSRAEGEVPNNEMLSVTTRKEGCTSLACGWALGRPLVCVLKASGIASGCRWLTQCLCRSTSSSIRAPRLMTLSSNYIGEDSPCGGGFPAHGGPCPGNPLVGSHVAERRNVGLHLHLAISGRLVTHRCRDG